MAGEKGHHSTRPGGAAEPHQGPHATTANLNEAIKIIEALVQSANWPERAKDAWKHVKKAATSAPIHAAPDASRDILELKTQVKGLTDLVKDIAKQSKAPMSYAEALRSKGTPIAIGKPDGQRV